MATKDELRRALEDAGFTTHPEGYNRGDIDVTLLDGDVEVARVDRSKEVNDPGYLVATILNKRIRTTVVTEVLAAAGVAF
jgi:hypothetical protein